MTSESHTFVLDQREAVPIILVPGIMGSRLKQRASGKRVWDPDGRLFMLWNYFRADGAERKETLIGERFTPDFLEPMSTGPWRAREATRQPRRVGRITVPPRLTDRDDRGIAGVAWTVYGDLLGRLYTAERSKSTGWPADVRRRFYLPVYAFGFNWTASCQDAGERLAREASDLIEAWKAIGYPCRRVILVTHSMGGLVARWAIDGAFADKVLGVIHGVQPVTGAATAYWRMRAGFPASSLLARVTRRILGRTAAEVTALLGNMPGGLQLLPTKNYRGPAGTAQWLTAPDPGGGPPIRRPAAGDPYAEIYREREAYWRLIDEALLDPVGVDGHQPQCPYMEPRDAWAQYLHVLTLAEEFHDALGPKKHPRTRAFFGSGTKEPTPGAISWSTSSRLDSYQDILPSPWDAVMAGLDGYSTPRFEYRSSGVTAHLESSGVSYHLDRFQDAGDGTVSVESGSALRLPDMDATSEDDPTPRPFECGQAAFPGLGHESAYSSRFLGGRSGPQAFTMNAIADLCRHSLQ